MIMFLFFFYVSETKSHMWLVHLAKEEGEGVECVRVCVHS